MPQRPFGVVDPVGGLVDGLHVFLLRGQAASAAAGVVGDGAAMTKRSGSSKIASPTWVARPAPSQSARTSSRLTDS